MQCFYCNHRAVQLSPPFNFTTFSSFQKVTLHLLAVPSHPSPSRNPQEPLSDPTDLPIPDISYKRNYIICGLSNFSIMLSRFFHDVAWIQAVDLCKTMFSRKLSKFKRKSPLLELEKTKITSISMKRIKRSPNFY